MDYITNLFGNPLNREKIDQMKHGSDNDQFQ